MTNEESQGIGTAPERRSEARRFVTNSEKLSPSFSDWDHVRLGAAIIRAQAIKAKWPEYQEEDKTEEQVNESADYESRLDRLTSAMMAALLQKILVLGQSSSLSNSDLPAASGSDGGSSGGQIGSSETASRSDSDSSESYTTPIMPALIPIVQRSSASAGSVVTHNVPNQQQAGVIQPGRIFMKYNSLMKTSLPTFDGRYEMWPSFWATYNYEVHVNPLLSNIEKMNILTRCLREEACDHVLAFDRDPSMYNEIIGVLNRNYNKPAMVSMRLVNKIRKRKPLREDNVADLRSLVSDLNAVIAGFRVTRARDDRYQVETRRAIMDLLPPQLRREVRRLEARDLPDIRDHLQHVLDLWEAADEDDFGQLPHDVKSGGGVERSQSQSTNNRGTAAKRQPERNVNAVVSKPAACDYSCLLCQCDLHATNYCPVYTTLETRKQRAAQLKACFGCLHVGHGARFCPNNPKCDGCSRRHHPLLCDGGQGNARQAGEGQPDRKFVMTIVASRISSVERPHVNMDTLPLITKSGTSYLMTQLATIFSKSEKRICRLLVDDGANLSLISKEICEQLNLPRTREQAFQISGAGGVTGPASAETVIFAIGPTNGEPMARMKAYVVDRVCNNIECVTPRSISKVLRRFGIRVCDCETLAQAKKTPIDLLIGADSVNGFLTGNRKAISDSLAAIQTTVGWCISGAEDSGNRSDAQVTMMITPPNGETIDVWSEDTGDDADQWLSEVDRLIEFRDGRYHVGLPWLWREPLDNNFAGAVHRLKRLVDRLRRTGWYEVYQHEINALVDGGYAEPIPFSRQDVAYYMPHREVIRDNSATTKVRVVFDASAHRTGHDSLNQRLSKGIDLNPAILCLLVRFRFGKVAASADLMKAFLQIRIREADRDWLRFLWIDGSDNLVAYRMTSVPFGATCSPFILAAVIRHHLWKNRASHPMTQKLADRIYVDDLLVTSDCPEEMRVIKNESCDLFEQCNMQFRKWRCSDRDLDAEWAEEVDSQTITSVLGLLWNVADDELAVKPVIKQHAKLTKRNLLSVMNSLFDPLGLCAPVSLAVRIAVRECMTATRVWDEEFEPEQLEHIEKSIRLLNELDEIWMPRCVAPNTSDHTALAMFSDASAKALGAVIYAVSGNNVNLIVSRSCLSANRSTPDLELQAAVLGAELLRKVVKWCQADRVVCFTDSEIVLHWLNTPLSELKSLYVVNRVRKVHQAVQSRAWNHVSSGHNPADRLTRGCSAKRLKGDSLWWHGPECLLNWEGYCSLHPPPTPQRLVNFVKRNAIEPTAWRNLWDEQIGKMPADVDSKQVYIEIWKTEQAEVFSGELDRLRKGQSMPIDSKLKKLVPFLDSDGLMRVRGRTQTGESDFDNPVVLDARGIRARVWLRYQHERLGHCGVQPLIAQARERFCIFKARDVCRNVVASCRQCIERRGQLAQVPLGLLPRERTTAGDCFRFVGADFIGPFELKSNVKRWILLITCMASRAIHLELGRGVSTTDVWRSFIQFMCRRGVPEVVYTDNGTSFVRIAKDIKLLYCALQSASRDSDMPPTITWRFNTPAAPWQGGFFERLVGCVKSCLPKLTSVKSPSDDEFRLWVTCAEAIVNSRPIGMLTNGTILSPGHLVIGKRPTTWPALDIVSEELPVNVYELLERRNSSLDVFWKAWHKTYLALLPDRYRSPAKPPKIEIGSVVLVADRSVPRGKWKFGTVQSLRPGSDGISRSATVRIDGVDYERPIQLLAFLETDSSVEQAL